jgi:hypothetical protein
MIIPAELDKRYRDAVIHAAGLADSAVQNDLERLFQGHPDPGGAQHAIAVLGDEIDATLKRSVRIVEALDHFYPGFKRWLGASGWGDDVRLIKYLAAWQEEAERKKWLHKSKPN